MLTLTNQDQSGSITCGWFTNAVTQKFGILLMSSVRRWKCGCRILLYFCSTLRISSLACSFSRSISFCTSSILSIASCWSLSVKHNYTITCTQIFYQNHLTFSVTCLYNQLPTEASSDKGGGKWNGRQEAMGSGENELRW